MPTSQHMCLTPPQVPQRRPRNHAKRIEPQPKDIGIFTTNADGRVSEKLLSDEDALLGVYEITFHAGDYLKALGLALPEYPFLDMIPIRFGISENAHYHVPLLLSPYGFSTYRGS